MPFIDDTCLITETGMVGATSNFYMGLHELHEMGFALHSMRPGDLFADVGANIGSYTVLASAVGARIVAVEPLPDTYSRLMRNLRYNGIDAKAHCCGLSSQPGELAFTTYRDAKNRVAEPGDGPTTGVPVSTLDAILDGQVPFLIKIDVEGHEPQVLAGSRRTLSDRGLQAVLMETTSHAAELTAIMREHGFEPHFYDAIARRLYPVQHLGMNTIFVRDADTIQQRCRTARRFALVNATI